MVKEPDSAKRKMSSSRINIGALMVSSKDLRQAGAEGAGAGIWSSSAALQTGTADLEDCYNLSGTLTGSQYQMNKMSCPNDSTLQCYCGHIDCPCCNLLMNLEITDPEILQ